MLRTDTGKVLLVETRGRKPVINEEIIDTLAGYIRMGQPKQRAAPLSGISERTFYNWMERGNAVLELVEKNPESEVSEEEYLYLQLLQSVQLAEAEFIRKAIKTISEEGPAGYKWLLARIFKDEFGDAPEGQKPVNIQLELPGLLSENAGE